MAAANCTLGSLPYRIETANTDYAATLTGVLGTIANSGSVNIEVKFALSGAPGNTGPATTQTEGQITLYPNQTFAISPRYSAFSYKSASAGEITWGPY